MFIWDRPQQTISSSVSNFDPHFASLHAWDSATATTKITNLIEISLQNSSDRFRKVKKRKKRRKGGKKNHFEPKLMMNIWIDLSRFNLPRERFQTKYCIQNMIT